MVRRPHEVAADRPAQLELVAGAQLTGQVGRDLPVGDPFHREAQPIALAGARDRVAPLRLVAVFGRQADVDVLPWQVPGPARHAQRDLAHVRRLLGEVLDRREEPPQSPA